MAEIYKIEDDIFHKVYIGQTVYTLEKRYKQHLQKATDLTDKTKLHTAMRELGVEHFFVELLEKCEEKDLDDREKYWIKYYNSQKDGYNMTVGGNGGSIYDIDEKEMRLLWDKGKSLKEIAEFFGCSTQSISQRLQNHPTYSIQEAMKRGSCKKIYCYDLVGLKSGEFDSASDAEAALNGESARGRDNIGACARGEQRQAYGYYWSYEDLDRGPNLFTIKGITCPIIQYTKDGKYVARYESLAEAERAMIKLGYKRPHISEVCQRRTSYQTSCGFVWRYIYDEEINRPLSTPTARLADKLN